MLGIGGKRILLALFAMALLTAAIVPALPILLISHFYNGDWFHHLWPVGFIANFLKHHHSIPFTSSSTSIVGYPVQVFSGSTLYPAAGLLGALLGSQTFDAELGLRFVCVGAMLVQFLLVYLVIHRVTDSRLWASTVAILVGWAIYPMTNLYNRGAIPEYVAGLLMQAAICGWFLTLLARTPRELAAAAATTALCAAFAIGTHPITALYGVPILAILFLASLPLVRSMPQGLRKPFFVAIALEAAFVTLVNAHWLYAAISFSGKLGAHHLSGLTHERGDNALHRFFPLPFDKETLLVGTTGGTPFLDVQINMPLLALCLFALIKKGAGFDKRALPGVLAAALLAAATLWLSLSAEPYRFLPPIAASIQFLYRQISFVNAMLLAFFICLSLLRRNAFAVTRKNTEIAIAALLTVSCCALIEKLVHVEAVKASKIALGREPTPSFDELPKNFPLNFAVHDYPALSAEENAKAVFAPFPLHARKEFGAIGETTVQLPKKSWVQTNLAAFPWNHLEIDGQQIAQERLFRNEGRFAIELPSGVHILHAMTVPDGTWRFLRALSYLVFGLGLLFLASLVLFPRLLAERQIARD